MEILEKLHALKRAIIKETELFYDAYFTEKGTYTSLLPDSIYLKRLYYSRTGLKLDLDNPRTFTEKLQWLKLHDRRPEYTIMADKYLARDYVMQKLEKSGRGTLKLSFVPLLGVWDRAEDIDFDKLPEQFVIKCNHDSGSYKICRDRSKFDVEQTRAWLSKRMKMDYFKSGREWCYKNIKRKIICEKFISEFDCNGVCDYKFFCFSGKVKALFVATDRPYDTRFDFYDAEFNHLPIVNEHKNAERFIGKPQNFDKMIEIAESLSEGIPHLRVDLYNIDGEVFFSEMTFYHFGGFCPLSPPEWEITFGNWLELPVK